MDGRYRPELLRNQLALMTITVFIIDNHELIRVIFQLLSLFLHHYC